MARLGATHVEIDRDCVIANYVDRRRWHRLKCAQTGMVSFVKVALGRSHRLEPRRGARSRI